MDYEGDYHEVFRQLAEHATAVRSGRSSPYCPWLIICPGTMRGVYGGGQVSALEERGLTDAFVGCVGVSTGAPTAAYFLARQARLGTTIYCEECTWPDFIAPHRLMRGGHGVDIGFLADVFRGKIGSKPLDENRIHASQAAFFVTMTEWDTGRGWFLNAKAVRPDIVHGIAASAAIPGMYRTPIEIGGKRFVDGGLSMPLPVTTALRERPSCIVVFANCSSKYEETFAKRCITRLIMSGQPRELRQVASGRHERFDQEYAALKASGVPYLIVWTDDEIGSYTRNPAKLTAAAERSRLHLHHLMDRAGI